MRSKASIVRNFGAIAKVLRLGRGSSGQTMAEYALILAAVALVAYAGFQVLGGDINAMLSSLGTSSF